MGILRNAITLLSSAFAGEHGTHQGDVAYLRTELVSDLNKAQSTGAADQTHTASPAYVLAGNTCPFEEAGRAGQAEPLARTALELHREDNFAKPLGKILAALVMKDSS